MQVNLYNDPDGEAFALNVDLAECFGDDSHGLAAAEQALKLQGQYWTGGGAAPAIFIATAWFGGING